MSPNPMVCERCGQPHGRCAGHNKAGGPCGRLPIKGGTVCPKHGGGAPQVRAAADARLLERQALLAVETFGLPVDVDPHQALVEELQRTAGAVAWLGAVVAGLGQDAVVWGKTRVKHGGEDAGTTHEARVNVWVQLWQQERRHLVDVSKACVSAGIDERRMQLAEDTGQLLAGVVHAVLGRLVLTESQWELVSVVVPEEFRRVAALPAGQVTA